jgi:hypothetical protein
MKTLLVAILLASAFAVKLDIPINPQIDDKNNRLKIGVLDVNSPVSFAFQGLPQGFELKGDQLSYTGDVGLQGQFPVKITATDANGKADTTIVLLNVNLSGTGISANSGIGSDPANAYLTRASVVTIGQISGANSGSSVSGSSSSSSTSSSSSSSGSSSSGASSNANGNQNAGSGSQVLSINGVNYNFGNSLSLNVGVNGNGVNQLTLGGDQNQVQSNSLNSIITQYSNNSNVISSSQNIAYYPVPALPSGPIPNSVPNTNVIQIATAQASVGGQPAKQFSEYDTNITNLFYEQTQLTQTIANLLEIIRQGTANRKQAQDDIDLYTGQLNSGVATQQNLSISISQQ